MAPCLMALLAGCAHQPLDTEEAAFYPRIMDSILLSDGGEAKPNKVVYVENPKVPPFRALDFGVRSGSVQRLYADAFGSYVLPKGWTVLCLKDKEKEKILIALVHDGQFQNFRLVSYESPRGNACVAGEARHDEPSFI